MAKGFSRAAKPRTSGLTGTRDGPKPGLRRSASKRDDEVTSAYIKRILCSGKPDRHDVSTQPIEALLPSLTASPAIDLQLYAFIAVILDNFVQTWYNRITPDQQFVSEVVQIIAHCSRGLEARLRHVDLLDLLLDELPGLLAEHIDTVRISRNSVTSSRRNANDVRMCYLALRPHVALDPVPKDESSILQQQDNEAAWSLLLANQILPLLLPPEDLANPCLDVLVSEIVADMIIRNGLCGKASESWLIWDAICKGITAARSSHHTRESSRHSRTTQNIQDGVHPDDASLSRKPGRVDGLVTTFWTVIQVILTSLLFLRAGIVAIMQAPSLPARAQPTRTLEGRLQSESTRHSAVPIYKADFKGQGHKQPIAGMQLWACASCILSLELRMPWLSGLLSLLQKLLLSGPGRLCSLDSRLDRLMTSILRDKILQSHWVPGALASARNALFPNNTLAPARAVPTQEEALAIRRQCAEAIVDAIPPFVRTRFFATSDEDTMRADVADDLLDLFADPYLNKHLLIRLIELLLVRTFPELCHPHDRP